MVDKGRTELPTLGFSESLPGLFNFLKRLYVFNISANIDYVRCQDLASYGKKSFKFTPGIKALCIVVLSEIPGIRGFNI
jgi:hypothetical protein